MEKPHGRNAVREAVLVAAGRMIADDGVGGVSFRRIAAEANVNHGLITRHFGTKDNLVREVRDRAVRSLFPDESDPAPTLRNSLEKGWGRHSHSVRILTRIFLEQSSAGPVLKEPWLFHEISRWTGAEQAENSLAPGVGSEVLTFLVGSLIFGSELVGPSLKESFGLDDCGWDRVRQAGFQVMLRGLDPPVVPSGNP